MSRGTKEIIEELSERYFHFNEYGERLDKTEAIPLIEREGLKDISHILQFKEYRFRPTSDKIGDVVCTYENVLTDLNSRMELLRWFNDDGGLHTADPSEDLKLTKELMLEDWNPSRFADMCKEYLNQLRSDPNEARIKRGLMPIPSYKAGAFNEWEPMRPIRTRIYTNPDCMAFSVLNKQNPSEGWDEKDLTDKNVREAINKAFPSEADRAAVLDAYRDMQAFLNVMAATYRLFATEQWDSIKDEDKETIKTALDNYFYHYKQDKQLAQFYKASGAKYEPRYKQSTLKSVCVKMGIPKEWRKYISSGYYQKPREANKKPYSVISANVISNQLPAPKGQLNLFGDNKEIISAFEKKTIEVLPEGTYTNTQKRIMDAFGMLLYKNSNNTDETRDDYFAGNYRIPMPTQNNEEIKQLEVNGQELKTPTIKVTYREVAKMVYHKEPNSNEVATIRKELKALSDEKSQTNLFKIVLRYYDEKEKKDKRCTFMDRIIKEFTISDDNEEESNKECVYSLHPMYCISKGIPVIIIRDDVQERILASSKGRFSSYTDSLFKILLLHKMDAANKPLTARQSTLLVRIGAERFIKRGEKNRAVKILEDSIEVLKKAGIIAECHKSNAADGEPKYTIKPCDEM